VLFSHGRQFQQLLSCCFFLRPSPLTYDLESLTLELDIEMIKLIKRAKYRKVKVNM